MKKQFVLLAGGLILLMCSNSCFRGHGISVSISESGNICRMSAHYPKNRTDAVQRILDERLNEGDDGMSFKNANIDGVIALNDRTTFYIESYPGELEIKLDKRKNSEESVIKVREAFEDIKDLLTGNSNNR